MTIFDRLASIIPTRKSQFRKQGIAKEDHFKTPHNSSEKNQQLLPVYSAVLEATRCVWVEWNLECFFNGEQK
jgi:hypothetical protein